ncbi:hypothetical protein [Burkholderia pseudomallei]|uniref:hypothetical protein n=1 Tax=Burkholderia pseudomallei TaxID=28450 RepID=UPI0005105919|nr:hypothetical protein [Burkholderia pseudomallei]KGC36992.1 hypothetical protein DO62_4606 [Burkholderia pseudomallei]KGS57460.1 hypothetical protein X949_3499 [Burkholderia pseudomallei MSHR5609]
MEQQFEQAVPATSPNTHQPVAEQRRTQRIELRVTAIERAQLKALALGSGYTNLAQYLRETGLHTGRALPPTADYQLQLQWLQAVNRIADHVGEIASQIVGGRQPDDDMLYYLLQIQEMAEDIWKEARQDSKPAGDA